MISLHHAWLARGFFRHGQSGLTAFFHCGMQPLQGCGFPGPSQQNIFPAPRHEKSGRQRACLPLARRDRRIEVGQAPKGGGIEDEASGARAFQRRQRVHTRLPKVSLALLLCGDLGFE